MWADDLGRAAATIEGDIAAGPIVPRVTAEEIRRHLTSRYDFTRTASLDQVTEDVEQMLRTWQVQVTHPRYFGLFNPSVSVASVVADTIVAMYNPQLATWRTSPAANEIERHTLKWLAAKFGLPSDAAANFTTGGAESNLSAVVVALTRAFPEYGERGIHGISGTPAIYVTSEAHASFSKIAHITGLGRAALRTIEVGRDLAMDLGRLSATVNRDRQEGRIPLMVVGTAGTTGAGAIDPLPDLARFCAAENLWFHVDAAWGGAAIISPRLRGALRGIEAADSITCDAHKWFSVPMAAGMFFCRHADAVRQAFRAQTSYMPPQSEAVDDPYVTSVQWSRRFIGLKLFLPLATLGERGYADQIEHQAHMGDVLRLALQRDGWRIVNRTPLPVVCFTRDGLVASEFVAMLHQRQIAWMSEVRLAGGPPVIRASVTSFRTTERDIEDVVAGMSRLFLQQSEVTV
jgi:glutamate/tyrosine decarboxylase-like PLP-dependent enzyme